MYPKVLSIAPHAPNRLKVCSASANRTTLLPPHGSRLEKAGLSCKQHVVFTIQLKLTPQLHYPKTAKGPAKEFRCILK